MIRSFASRLRGRRSFLSVSIEHSSAGPSPRSDPPDAGNTGARLGLALLAYMLAVTLITTLLPFSFAWPERWRIAYVVEALDVVANVLLFVPLGFFYRFARGAERTSVLHVLVAGTAASAAIELSQLFELVRYASPVDVASNAV